MAELPPSFTGSALIVLSWLYLEQPQGGMGGSVSWPKRSLCWRTAAASQTTIRHTFITLKKSVSNKAPAQCYETKVRLDWEIVARAKLVCVCPLARHVHEVTGHGSSIANLLKGEEGGCLDLDRSEFCQWGVVMALANHGEWDFYAKPGCFIVGVVAWCGERDVQSSYHGREAGWHKSLGMQDHLGSLASIASLEVKAVQARSAPERLPEFACVQPMKRRKRHTPFQGWSALPGGARRREAHKWADLVRVHLTVDKQLGTLTVHRNSLLVFACDEAFNLK
eukprot:5323286-Amphidinium_carterae.1